MQHIDDKILKRLAEQEKRGGIQIGMLQPGTRIEAKTKNTLYEIEILDPVNRPLIIKIHGGSYFKEPASVQLNGSTWGGAMLKLGWLGIGMCMEFAECTTTPVQSLKVIAPDKSWEYEI